MRKLLCIAMLLLCLALPALAESAAVPEEMVGEWIPTMQITTNPKTYTESIPLLITADGFFTYDHEDAPRYPIRHDNATGAWYIQNPDGPGTLTLMMDAHGQLLAFDADGAGAMLLRRPDAPEPELPPTRPYTAIGGDWQARALYGYHSDGNGFSCIVDFEALGLPMPVISLPAFASYDVIAAAWKSAASQTGAESVISLLQDIYGYDLLNSDSLFLVSSSGLIILERIAVPEVDADLAEHAAQLAGWWRPDALSVGGIALAAEALDYSVTSACLAVDEQGHALLGNDVVVPLQMVDGDVCIGSYPVCLLDDGTLIMTLADGVEARFITEGAWYRRQIIGTWQLSKIKVPALSMEKNVDPALLDVQLVIDADGCILRTAEGETVCTLESTDDVIEYLLVGSEPLTLTIASLSTLRISNESESFTLWFKPAE